MIYFFSFTVSIALCWVGEKTEIRRSKKLSFVLWFFSILILVSLAGFRDYTVGTDIRIYGNLIFRGAVGYHDPGRFIRDYGWRAEPLYLILNYAISRLTNSAHWLYATIGAIMYTCFFIGLYRCRDRISLTYGWTVFILLFYAQSFNMMRQMLAMSMIFMGSIHILKKKYIRYLPYAILAALFHQTSIVFSVAIIGMRILIPKKNKWFYQFFIILSACFLIFGYSYLLQWLTKLGMLAEKYNQYIYQYRNSIAINPLIQRSFPIILFYFFTRVKYKDEEDVRVFLLSMMFLDLILVTMGSLGDSPLQRVAFYCSIYNLYAYPFFLRRIRTDDNKAIVGTLIIVALTGIWIYQVVYRGNGEIWPYTSEVLGIG